mmetsp:Transcript_23600/g.53578  ORF Transcript_23600/g.53578 Transcript_23600/m.53578 type:complete len:740 (+) Transcript_23600:248-2467(+)
MAEDAATDPEVGTTVASPRASAWGTGAAVASDSATFADIMRLQEQESKSKQSSRGVSFSNQVVETEEERMLRLAIEASLKHSQVQEEPKKMPPSALRNVDSSNAVESESEEERMVRLAIEASLQDSCERKPSSLPTPSDATGSSSDGTIAAEHYDAKPPASSSDYAAPAASDEDESERLARELHEQEIAQLNETQTKNDSSVAASLELAMRLQREENALHSRSQLADASRLKREEMCHGRGGNVSVSMVSRSEFERMKSGIDGCSSIVDQRKHEEVGMLLKGDIPDGGVPYSSATADDDLDQYYYYDYDKAGGAAALEADDMLDDEVDGFRMNSQSSSKWSRFDKDRFIGPDGELRTKHDVEVKHRANAANLLGSHGSKLEHAGSSKAKATLSDRAYNAYKRAETRQQGMKKGVARGGTGRAEDPSSKTRGGGMDGNVRLEIAAAINSGIINHCNGAVKEGKEAVVYHADAGDLNVGSSHDVAVKVFKRIAEFKGRGAYVDSDPRYHKQAFKTQDGRHQVVLWAEKEHRNLIRASRAGCRVPQPLHHKENVLFMRFLGDNGWPSPQLREIEIKLGSKKWTVFYCQILVQMRRLYHCARLVHADLSEYNILVCPTYQTAKGEPKPISDRTDDDEALQTVIIDFGQAVEVNHSQADAWLRRDIETIHKFFTKKGIKVFASEEAEEYILEEVNELPDDNNDDSNQIESPKGDDEPAKEWRHLKAGLIDEEEMELLISKLGRC